MSEYSPLGLDLFGEVIQARRHSPVNKRFILPPFSTLNTRDGEWVGRRDAWLSLGIKSEVGRATNLAYGPTTGSFYDAKNEWEEREGKKISTAEFLAQHYVPRSSFDHGTSVFDPVLCELCYRWWCPKGGTVVDPFAGGSVRGVIASCLGLRYWGCDLRSEQIDANRAQGAELSLDPTPEWVAGDSAEMVPGAPDCDFVFTCPPYGDLEVYSEDPRDISGMDWPKFCSAYIEIISAACQRLRPNRFAAIVVSDFRDKDGFLRNFPALTTHAFGKAGLRLYNEAILLNSVGSGAMRINNTFGPGRKLVRLHQNVLVYVKGEPMAAGKHAREGKDEAL